MTGRTLADEQPASASFIGVLSENGRSESKQEYEFHRDRSHKYHTSRAVMWQRGRLSRGGAGLIGSMPFSHFAHVDLMPLDLLIQRR
jgi:hypothetical protein